MPVKDIALYGAQEVGNTNNPSRLISILPRSKFCSVEYNITPKTRHLIINTNFRDARNLVNGYIPDVVIAIGGGLGTLSELTFAATVNTPIVFLQTKHIDTLAELKTYLSALINFLNSIL